MRCWIAIAILTAVLTICAVFWGITSATLADVRMDRDSLADKLASVQSWLQDVADELASVQSWLQDIQSELTEAQSELQDTRTDLLNTQDELEAAQTDLANTQAELDSAQAELANTQTELTATQAELANTEAELAAAQEQIDDLQAEVAYWQDICCGVGNTLSVHFIDVGQGDSVLIDFGAYEILIDGGPDEQCAAYIADYVDGSLEVMVATHPDADHIGGLIAVLDTFEVNEIWLNGDTHTTQTYSQFMAAVDSEGAEVHEARRGDHIEAGCLTFLVLNPIDLSGTRNNNSIVLSLSYGEVDFLFTGDAEEEAEASMLTAGIVPNVEILKVGHHGSRGASSQDFLNVVQPDDAIIMVGDNSYGHPHAETIDRLTGIGAEIYRTDVNGTVLVTSDGVNYSVKTENDGEEPPPVATAASSSPVCLGETLELYGGPDGMASYSWVGPEGWTSDAQNPSRPNVTYDMAGDYTLTVTDGNGLSDSNTTSVVVCMVPGGISDVQITYIFYDGVVSQFEPDEYVEITNLGNASQDLEGWVLKDISEGYPSFTFPSYILDPGESIRVYTNEVHPEWGGFSFGYGNAIWQNTAPGDTAALYNAQDQEVSRMSYY